MIAGLDNKRQRPPYRTRAGVMIGAAYVPKRDPATFTSSEEIVQRALLAKPKPRRSALADVAFAVAIGVASAVFLAWALAR
jgi:hypothetical protein